MRVLIGMILGVILTVVAAYSVDSMNTSTVASGPNATDNKQMVNWDVVQTNWKPFKERSQQGWSDLRARVDRS